MSQSHPTNLAASVRQRLLNLSVSKGEDPNLTLTRYAMERLLYRLTRSEYSEQFVLKGAMLFALWTESPHRPTRDLDLLGFGEASNERLREIFQRICEADVEPDGLEFDHTGVRSAEIREGQTYQGQRVKLVGLLGKARIPLQIDIGFGDAVTPDAQEIDYPTLLDLPAPRIRAYPPETVVAEKLQAMIALGMQNSRMKDFFDLWVIARQFSFQGPVLVTAIQATFERRQTDLPKDIPTGLSDEFATDEQKLTQWTAFLTRSHLAESDMRLRQVVDELRNFLLPVLAAAENGREFEHRWRNGGPWTSSNKNRT
tara:strand:- start:4183 stop:5121 length:939 start_codon:yes stop_codon:yes gene_type:complete